MAPRLAYLQLLSVGYILINPEKHLLVFNEHHSPCAVPGGCNGTLTGLAKQTKEKNV